MRKSPRALVGMIVLDLLMLAGTGWMVPVQTSTWATTVRRGDASARSRRLAAARSA